MLRPDCASRESMVVRRSALSACIGPAVYGWVDGCMYFFVCDQCDRCCCGDEPDPSAASSSFLAEQEQNVALERKPRMACSVCCCAHHALACARIAGVATTVVCSGSIFRWPSRCCCVTLVQTHTFSVSKTKFLGIAARRMYVFILIVERVPQQLFLFSGCFAWNRGTFSNIQTTKKTHQTFRAAR